ncbi:MAG: hypothetical protein H8D63_00800 [Parcubacteria group bacterium]|nr:hypothetical protein [Parcubacteria group bacterium]
MPKDLGNLSALQSVTSCAEVGGVARSAVEAVPDDTSSAEEDMVAPLSSAEAGNTASLSAADGGTPSSAEEVLDGGTRDVRCVRFLVRPS